MDLSQEAVQNKRDQVNANLSLSYNLDLDEKAIDKG
jgi:hypothetical protein